MARRVSTAAPTRAAALSFNELQAAIPRLKRRIAEVEAFVPRSVTQNSASAAASGLRASIEEALTQTFGHDTVEFARYEPAARFDKALDYTWDLPIHHLHESLEEYKGKSLALLGQAVKALEERLAEIGVPVAQAAPAAAAFDATNRDVFLVHGHDSAAREATARFLERAGFHPVILSEQTNKGRTLIEKFEDHSNVGFAVVLLTADDVGGVPGLVVDKLKGRARQNVILELGYFIAKLGRSRICVLKSGDVEIPSDVLGIGYTDLDAGGAWQIRLAKELQDAGYDVDLNKAIRL